MPRTNDREDILVTLEPGNPNTLNLRVSSNLKNELSDLLTTEGIHFSRGEEFSSEPIRELLVATVENPAFWPALASVVNNFWRRHQNKSVEVYDEDRCQIRASGMSAKEVENIISTAYSAQEQSKKEWEDMDRRLGTIRTNGPGN